MARSALAQLMAGLILTASPVDEGNADHVEVPLDSPIYDKPSNKKTKRPQILKAGTKVVLTRTRIDDWCQVAPADVPIPGGSGWIWCGIDNDGNDYRLKPVTDDAPKK